MLLDISKHIYKFGLGLISLGIANFVLFYVVQKFYEIVQKFRKAEVSHN